MMNDLQDDPRFKHVAKDPRFRQLPVKERKVKIDKRFQSMFSDKRFKLKYSFDKRGRPVDTSTNENLKKYYELSSESGSEEEDEDHVTSSDEKEDSGVDDESVESNTSDDSETEIIEQVLKKIAKKKSIGSSESVGKLVSSENKQKNVDKGKKLKKKEMSSDDDDDDGDSSELDNQQKKSSLKTSNKKTVISAKTKDDEQKDETSIEQDKKMTKLKNPKEKSKKELIDMATAPDLARGGVLLESSSEEEDSDDDLDGEIDHGWGELDKGVPDAKELGHRLAICNMDWDRVKAHDLFLLFNSFVPTGGILHSVTIYPSEYGLERMAEEERTGPVELTKTAVAEPDQMDETPDGSCYHREKLRQYQLNRLKYYYAVADFDSINTANHVYDECDGREFESSSSKLDLRYIPDDMIFEEIPKSECTSIAAANYKPQNFFTSALCQSKVDLTWDETDRDRISVTMRKFQKEEINEDDFKAFLASDSEGEVNYSGVVSGSDDSDLTEDEEKQIEKYKQLLQGIDDTKQSAKDKQMDMEITWEPGLKETAGDIVKKKGRENTQTPWEEYLHKKKEKKKEIKEKKRSATEKREIESEARATEFGEAFGDDELPPGVNLSDSFFTDELKSSDKLNKKGQKKKKKRKNLSAEELAKEKQEQAELALLTMEENEEGKHHFSLNDLVKDKKKKKKKLRTADPVEVTDDFQIKVDDPRFGAMYSSHLFNIDPSAPEFKRTKGIEAIIEEKFKRRNEPKPKNLKHSSADDESMDAKRRKHSDVQDSDSFSTTVTQGEGSSDISLTSLVKSVKAKTKQFHSKNKFR